MQQIPKFNCLLTALKERARATIWQESLSNTECLNHFHSLFANPALQRINKHTQRQKSRLLLKEEKLEMSKVVSKRRNQFVAERESKAPFSPLLTFRHVPN